MSGNRQDTPDDGRRRYRRIAPLYDLLDLPFEYARYRRLRRMLFAGLAGRILDAGVGTGRNLPFYPAGSEVVGIDVSPEMLARARRRRGQSAARVELLERDVCATGLGDDSFDAVVASFLVCVLPEERQLPALRELARVCRPGGEIRLLDLARPRQPLRRLLTRLGEPYARRAFGASFDRDVAASALAAGLQVVEQRRVGGDRFQYLAARPPG
jgi:ubiquinone/menaquinone biosynthesis C-methylase UbiE